MIYIGTYGNIEFNAISENGIQIYPISAQQYVSGIWVNKSAKIWQNNHWFDWWDGSTIYEIGNEYTFITGGWGKVAPNSVISGTFEITNEGMKVSASSSSGRHCYRTHNNEIDLTNYRTIECTAYGHYDRSCLVLSKADGTQGANVQITSGSPTTYTLDISSVTGKWYIGFGVWFQENATYAMTMQKIKLIK